MFVCLGVEQFGDANKKVRTPTLLQVSNKTNLFNNLAAAPFCLRACFESRRRREETHFSPGDTGIFRRKSESRHLTPT